MRLCNFWLDLAAAKTPDVQRVRYTNADLFAQAQTGPRFRRYGYAFGHEPVMTTTISHPELCVLVQYPG